MRPSRHVLHSGLLVCAVGLAACQQASQVTEQETSSGAESIAGSYSCAPDPPPDDPAWPGPEDWELSDDGTLTISRGGEIATQGTWSAEGEQLVVQHNGDEGRFNIEGAGFVSAESVPAGEGIYTCTKEAS